MDASAVQIRGYGILKTPLTLRVNGNRRRGSRSRLEEDRFLEGSINEREAWLREAAGESQLDRVSV